MPTLSLVWQSHQIPLYWQRCVNKKNRHKRENVKKMSTVISSILFWHVQLLVFIYFKLQSFTSTDDWWSLGVIVQIQGATNRHIKLFPRFFKQVYNNTFIRYFQQNRLTDIIRKFLTTTEKNTYGFYGKKHIILDWKI